MFGLFKKKPKVYPPFETLQRVTIKDKYFVRLAQWDWLNDEMIHVFDNHVPRIITMDPWPQIIYLEADGKKTISEFVYQMADQYGKNEIIPAELDVMILDLIQDHINENLVDLVDVPRELPKHLALPKREQR